ncbi:MAG: twin-arginine translocase subunit TatC [Candidatus Geothermarchaeales archaeon]
MSKEMTFMEHIEELRARLIRIIAAVGGVTVFTFTFGVRCSNFSSYSVCYPFPDIFENIVTLFFLRLQQDLVPSYVRIIQTEPSEAIVTLVYVSLFLGIILAMPVILYELARFLAPGLKPGEKKLIVRITVPATLLFALGSVFAYYLVIPYAIDFLFSYGLALGAETFLTLESFIGFVLLFVLAFGLSFQLPLIMVGLDALGVVDRSFWKENFSYAVIAILVFGAIITPDGSGITMFMVAAPLVLLYLLGYVVIRRRKGED